MGAALVIAADILCRMVVAPAELPIGIITALIGAPFFVSILLRRRGVVDLEAVVIVADTLTIRAGGRALIDGVDLALRPGVVTAVVGPNGAGKSTLVKALTGEIAPSGGRVSLDGIDLARLSPSALAARRAVLPQASTLSFPFTVHEVVRLGVADRRRAAGADARVVATLARVDLAGFGGRLYPGAFRRRAAARASRPRALPVPEPCPGGERALSLPRRADARASISATS